MTEQPPHPPPEFRDWVTPFGSECFTLLDIHCSAEGALWFHLGDAQDRPHWRGDVLAIAYRVQDEGGLVGLWSALSQSPQRGARCFMVRGTDWGRESPLSFLPGDGWCYVLATADSCLEFAAAQPPVFTRL